MNMSTGIRQTMFKQCKDLSKKLQNSTEDLEAAIKFFEPLEIELGQVPIVELAQEADDYLGTIIEIYQYEQLTEEDLQEIRETWGALRDDLGGVWDQGKTDLPPKIEKLLGELNDLALIREEDTRLTRKIIEHHIDYLEDAIHEVIVVLHEILELAG